MKKTVQIPYELFLELVKYHLGEIPADEDYICKALQDKLDRLAMHESYTRNLQNKGK